MYIKNFYCGYLLFFCLVNFLICCKKDVHEKYLFEVLSSEKTGLSFINQLQDTPQLNILTYLYYYNGAGVAVADFNNDGFKDLYFVANQAENKLFLNRGNLQFQENTPEILKDKEGWSTGVSIVDINTDGLPDIYLCKVGGGYRGINGKNKLFIHQGLDANGVPVFKEEASNYNLDISSFSTQSSFFDYDLDGDLDMFLLNHSVHPNRTYGRGTKRKQTDSLSGDRLYQNNSGIFKDVSNEAGIFQGVIGYGLGLATSDINNDGYPDIYVGNDFFENDYLYINQKDGTFKELISSKDKGIGHTSHFSMGVDIADINNDGLTDILSLDMLPEDIATYKSSGTEYGFTIYNQYLKNGYRPQYMQNALQLNRGNCRFSEIAFYSGIAATEWSWAPLIADYDNDGYKDIFISNGIKGATNDMDFISFIANDNIQKRINKGMTKEDLALIDELPEKKTANYFYKNNGDLTFIDQSGKWVKKSPSFSNGAIYADLDNDGDLDVVTNNINDNAFIYENRSDTMFSDKHFVKIELKGNKQNPNAIGAKVIVYHNRKTQIAELFTARGYLSSVTTSVHLGLGKDTVIDSVVVRWPDGETSVHRQILPDTINNIRKPDAVSIASVVRDLESFQNISKISIPYKHQDYETKDFNTEPLAPYAISNEAPHVSVVDVNKDSLDDIFIPGGRFRAGSLWLQDENAGFTKSLQPDLEKYKQYEDIDQVFLDADTDGDLDLIVIYGGNERFSEYETGPKLFLNHNNSFTLKKEAFPLSPINGSVVIATDIDNDTDQDVFIGSNAVSGSYGTTPRNYVFENDGNGNFVDITAEQAPDLSSIGQIFDAKFVDINQDGYNDLVVAGHYLPITILLNDGNGKFDKLKNSSLKNTNGWWNSIVVEDMDLDGDLDIVAGNWGTNSRLSASLEEPIRLYQFDFDNNGKIDPIVTYFYQGIETPIVSKEELVKQIPNLNKKFLSYRDFANADMKAYFSNDALKQAEKKEVYTLKTTYFENTGNMNFRMHPLPWQSQISAVHDILINDINKDGFPDLIVGGNTYEINTQLSRLDASYGEVLINNGKGEFFSDKNYSLEVSGAVRSIQPIEIKEEEYLLFGINNDSIQIVKKNHNKE